VARARCSDRTPWAFMAPGALSLLCPSGDFREDEVMKLPNQVTESDFRE
jgi:hypothetical protein